MSNEQPLAQVGVSISSTGRACMFAVPPDLTDAELLELVTWMANPTGLRAILGPRSSSMSSIVVPKPVLVRPS